MHYMCFYLFIFSEKETLKKKNRYKVRWIKIFTHKIIAIVYIKTFQEWKREINPIVFIVVLMSLCYTSELNNYTFQEIFLEKCPKAVFKMWNQEAGTISRIPFSLYSQIKPPNKTPFESSLSQEFQKRAYLLSSAKAEDVKMTHSSFLGLNDYQYEINK